MRFRSARARPKRRRARSSWTASAPRPTSRWRSNLVGRGGATFGLARVKGLALENGFAETGSGTFERRGANGAVAMTIRLQDGDAKRSGAYATGLTFALDVPHVTDPVSVSSPRWASLAEAFGRELGGELVDDQRKPLAASGLAAIRRSLEPVVRSMEAHGIAAGGALARRLFA